MNDVNRANSKGCYRIPGSSQLHSIFGPDQRDPTKLLVRQLSCFCRPCLEENFNECEKRTYVRAWSARKIQPQNVLFAATQMAEEDDEESWEYEYDGESMGDLVQPGDNFAVHALEDNDEGVSFYIL